MTLLLPDDQDPTVVTMATKISLRVAEEKIIQWMNKHITVGEFFVVVFLMVYNRRSVWPSQIKSC